jgi:hypothetical protein
MMIIASSLMMTPAFLLQLNFHNAPPIRDSFKNITDFYGAECSLFTLGCIIIAVRAYFFDQLSATQKRIVEISLFVAGLATLAVFGLRADIQVKVLSVLLLPLNIVAILGLLGAITFIRKNVRPAGTRVYIVLTIIIAVSVIFSPIPKLLYSWF